MSIKLALRNVQKSFQNYVIYFITLIIAVCMFFTFNTFQAQGLVDGSALSAVMESAGVAMDILMIFVALVLGFLICYANIFMMKKRSKEMATYMLLGMGKRKMSWILALEVVFVGILALVIGIVVGIFASQFLMTYVSKILVGSVSYEFVFSFKALLVTLVSFVLLFFVVILVSLVAVNKLKLIDLIQADKKVDKAPISNVYISSIICLISILGFIVTYKMGMFNLVKMMAPVLLVGGFSTILFFLSLSGFIVALSSKWKGAYYKNLNMYSIRQVNANVASNFLSMSMVCLMVLVAMMSLAVGFSVNDMLSQDLHYTDISGDARYTFQYPNNLETPEERIAASTLQEQYIKEITTSPYVKSIVEVPMFFALSKDENAISIPVVTLNDLNAWRAYKGEDAISINPGTAIFVPSNFKNLDENNVVVDKVGTDFSGGQFHVYGQDYVVKTGKLNEMNEFQLISSGEGYYVIDAERPKASVYDSKEEGRFSQYSSITMTFQSKENEKAFNTYAKELYETKYRSNFCSIYPESVDCKGLTTSPNEATITAPFYLSMSQAEVEQSMLGNKLVYTFMGLYLGVIFIVCSAVVLAIQLISHATQQKGQYEILSKIGASKQQINKTVFVQCATYFLIPLLLAIIHSVFGLISFANLFASEQAGGDAVFFKSAIPMGVILLVIFTIYFVITYMSYQRIIRKKQA